MTTFNQALAAIKARITTIGGITALYQDEDNQLPDTPAPFVFFEFVTFPASVAGFGGGRGQNLYRNPAELNAYVFVPRGQGLETAGTLAEQVASAFRSYRSSEISCFGATVHPIGDGSVVVPPGLQSTQGSYSCVVVSIEMFFDQVG